MSFLFFISSFGVIAWAVSHLLKRPLGLRAAMRWGMGLGFLFTGVDHFVSASTRYAPAPATPPRSNARSTSTSTASFAPRCAGSARRTAGTRRRRSAASVTPDLMRGLPAFHRFEEKVDPGSRPG